MTDSERQSTTVSTKEAKVPTKRAPAAKAAPKAKAVAAQPASTPKAPAKRATRATAVRTTAAGKSAAGTTAKRTVKKKATAGSEGPSPEKSTEVQSRQPDLSIQPASTEREERNVAPQPEPAFEPRITAAAIVEAPVPSSSPGEEAASRGASGQPLAPSGPPPAVRTTADRFPEEHVRTNVERRPDEGRDSRRSRHGRRSRYGGDSRQPRQGDDRQQRPNDDRRPSRPGDEPRQPRQPDEERRSWQDEDPRPVRHEEVDSEQSTGPMVPGERPAPVIGEGVIEISGKGFGFLRDPKRNFQQSQQDIFVTPELVRRFALRDGLWVVGEIRRGSRGPQLLRITQINGREPNEFKDLPLFEELTTLNPEEWIRLETTPDRFTTRVIDMMAPIGKGQRGLIVAPPRTGKTTLLQHIADAVVINHPKIKLIILLVDERPEEVTEIRRTVPQAEIMASSNDSDLKSHTRIAELAIERAKRLVEAGEDVFILLDSITRVGRAFNNATAGGGRTLSGGMDARAMETPRRLFAAARNTEEAGSLTIIATALIDTGSRMDELIFQEFKGTGNMELVLDRRISDQRVYPAIDIYMSGTRREELLLPEEQLDKISVIRRGLAGHKPIEAIERLLSFLRKFPTNAQMLGSIPSNAV